MVVLGDARVVNVIVDTLDEHGHKSLTLKQFYSCNHLIFIYSLSLHIEIYESLHVNFIDLSWSSSYPYKRTNL